MQLRGQPRALRLSFTRSRHHGCQDELHGEFHLGAGHDDGVRARDWNASSIMASR